MLVASPVRSSQFVCYEQVEDWPTKFGVVVMRRNKLGRDNGVTALIVRHLQNTSTCFTGSLFAVYKLVNPPLICCVRVETN